MTLIRGLSLGHLTALLINGIIGAGILGLPARAFALTGEFSLVAWLAAGVVVTALALCFAEVSSRYRETGGAYLYALEAFGPTVAFMTGWLTWISRVVAIASICSLLVGYAGAFTGGTIDGGRRLLLLAVAFGALTVILVRGIRETAWASTLLTLAKLSLLVGFVAVGLWTAPVAGVAPGPPPSFADASAAVALLLFAFFGFENGTFASGEVVEPERNMPIAILTAITVATILYLLIQLVCMATVPDLAASSRPVADSVERLLGAGAGRLVAAAAITMMVGTMLAVLVGATRLMLAMAERGQLPKAFAALHPRFRTPVNAIVFTGAVGFVAALFSTFATALAIAVTTRVLTYIVVCLALPALRRSTAPPPAFRLRFGASIALISAAVCAWLITTTSVAELATTLVVALAGWIWWSLSSRAARAAAARVNGGTLAGMRSWLVLLILAGATGLAAAQEKPVPSDSSRITIPGCAKDRSFIVDQPEGREISAAGIQPGRRFRLSGPRAVLNDIHRREGTMVEITGLVRKSDLAGPGGVRLFGGRVRIGGAPQRDAMRDPMYNQVVIDVEAFQLLPDRCPDR